MIAYHNNAITKWSFDATPLRLEESLQQKMEGRGIDTGHLGRVESSPSAQWRYYLYNGLRINCEIIMSEWATDCTACHTMLSDVWEKEFKIDTRRRGRNNAVFCPHKCECNCSAIQHRAVYHVLLCLFVCHPTNLNFPRAIQLSSTHLHKEQVLRSIHHCIKTKRGRERDREREENTKRGEIATKKTKKKKTRPFVRYSFSYLQCPSAPPYCILYSFNQFKSDLFHCPSLWNWLLKVYF